MLAMRARLTIEWFVPLGQARAITNVLQSVADETRVMRGCIGCSVLTDIGTRGTVRYSEEWETEADLRARIRSDNFPRLASLMEASIQPPTVEIVLAHQTRGLDFVEEVRAHS
jgi:quinol monooxygenase YgiN